MALIVLCSTPGKSNAQIAVMAGAMYNMPEHGFLPGKKFPIYPTINKYNLQNKRLRIELYDDRDSLGLEKLSCSDVSFTRTSEFEGGGGVEKVSEYLDSLFRQNGAIPDLQSTDVLQVRLEGLDCRLIGFGKIKVHGLCQMKFTYHGKAAEYCIDITDGDDHAPLSSNAFVTRKTATRYMVSTAIREVIEQFLAGLKD